MSRRKSFSFLVKKLGKILTFLNREKLISPVNIFYIFLCHVETKPGIKCIYFSFDINHYYINVPKIIILHWNEKYLFLYKIFIII